MMERLTILAPSARIDDAAVRQAIEQMDSRESASETLADTEADQIRRVLAATNGNKSRAAKILGIERKTLYRKLERMGLVIPLLGDRVRAACVKSPRHQPLPRSRLIKLPDILNASAPRRYGVLTAPKEGFLSSTNGSIIPLARIAAL